MSDPIMRWETIEAWQREAYNLPPLRNEAPHDTDRPTPTPNVSHETLQGASTGETPPPPVPLPVDYGEDMETNTDTDRLTQVVGDLINILVERVTSKVTSAMEDIAEEKAEEAVNASDPADHYNFSSAVEEIVRDVLSGASWSVTYEG